MGSTSWSDDFYRAREDKREKTGESAFKYHEEMRYRPRSEKKVHAEMNPLKVTRESRDSENHPRSKAIIVPFDHTGSMGEIPLTLQKKLGKLMAMLTSKNYISDPQILFGAIGDANYDKAPVQVGQFESGIEMDDDLGKLLLEGGGGPYGEESYELMLYFAARHTAIDCYEKRGEKGYLFLIGDEEPYSKVSAKQVRDIFGDDLKQDITIENIVKEAKEKYNVFFIVPVNASGGSSSSIYRRWVKLLGQEYVLKLDDPDTVCEAIALAIGLHEERINLDEGVSDLEEYGVDKYKAKNLTKALTPMAESAVATVQDFAGIVPAKKRSGKIVRL